MRNKDRSIEYSGKPGNFKAGDIISCIDAKGCRCITEGKTYIAKSYFPVGVPADSAVTVTDDDGLLSNYMADRFVLSSTVEFVEDDEVELPDVEDLSRSLLEECFAFGLDYDVIYRAMQNMQAKTVEAMSKRKE